MPINKSLRRRITDWLGLTNATTVMQDLGGNLNVESRKKKRVAMYCINNPHHHPMFKETEGARCIKCNALVAPREVSEAIYYGLPSYSELRNERKRQDNSHIKTSKIYSNRAQCLVCNHTASVIYDKKADYQEVSVCPRCKGAFVDTWKISKYLNS